MNYPDYPFTPRQIKLNGHELSYLDEGQGPVVVMLHGNPTWSYYYRNLVLLLRDRFRIIAPDHMGCGLSSKPRNYPYQLDTHIRNVEQLLTSLEIKKFSLIVHDWGGAIGMGVAANRAQDIETLVILNTAAFRSHRIPLRIRICRTPFLGDFLVRGLNGFAKAALVMAVSKPLESDIAGGYLAPYNSWKNRIGVLRFVQDIPLSERDISYQTLMSIENSLFRFKKTPMLLLWGGRDFCFTTHFYEQWLQRFPEAEPHFFKEAGHYVLEDAFEQIAPILVAFYEKNLRKIAN